MHWPLGSESSRRRCWVSMTIKGDRKHADQVAVGTPASLKSRFATYELHLSAAHVPPTLEILQKHFPGAHRSLDTLTRISIPGVTEDHLPRLLAVVQDAKQELGLEEVTVHEASTETAFLSIVKEHNVQEEERHEGAKRSWWSRVFGRGSK